MKNQYIGENILKRGLGQFADLKRGGGGLTKKTRGGGGGGGEKKRKGGGGFLRGEGEG